MNRNKQEKGITLVALIITIIVLLILAGVVIAMTIGDEGIINKSQHAVEEYKKSEIKEELQLAVTAIQMKLTGENKTISINTIANELRENYRKYLSETLQNLEDDGTNGEYKGYSFYIDNKTFEVILGTTIINNESLNKNYIIFNGNSYIKTDIDEQELVAGNQEFTIAASVYINREIQSSITSMGIIRSTY